MTLQSAIRDNDDAPASVEKVDTGLYSVALVAGYFRIAADPRQLGHELGLAGRLAESADLVAAAKRLELKARWIANATVKRLTSCPLPAVIGLKEGGFLVLAPGGKAGQFRLADPVRRSSAEVDLEQLAQQWDGNIVLITRRAGGAGVNPKTFGFSWFLPSIWRYRRVLSHVLLASFFVQIFGLITPLFFQLVVDKVLVHKAMSTLIVLVVGMVSLGLFEATLQYLRTYALSHTTNRIDVELGRRLFHHLFRLPIAYFETRATGQTIARVRELETIRNFLTGQGLTSLLDLFFTFVFVGVLFLYSVPLTLVVLATLPLYVLIAGLIRPFLREKIREKFNRGARSQQFLVESIVGALTLKAASVEPIMQAEWEDRLAAYVRTSFEASMLGSLGQNLIQYVGRLTTAMILLFGAQAVIAGMMTVGELIAFNMISSQVLQPILRLSQLWQDLQQVQVSVERLGDILNTPVEPIPASLPTLPPPKGDIELRDVSFRYQPGRPEVLRNISLRIKAGEVIGIVGPSGSGKSTLTKLIQRLYLPERGQVLLDGVDVAQLDPSWLRRQIGVVLQENLLFNRTIHENIALANPAMTRAQVMHVARLGGADEFIGALPQGYDTMIEERGSNLSGGQRQRIAIARALATNPRILILDEATSALDYESERIIQNNMRAITKGRTVIIIAHRLAAVRPCSRIIGMSDARIVEQGNHDQLIANSGSLYGRLWSMQNDWTK
ncbi:type I secretion system permease/ATPase [Bradyrhizobium sp. 26S5]|uniref:type I secretion system permease/ATPase n=1 Tax=Bradyrhizobium sp. 26S5 TaxID=3139729 RepID=UPI0030D1D48B